MENAPKKVAKLVKVGLIAAMHVASPAAHNADDPLERGPRIEMPARPRDLRAQVAKEENGRLVMHAPAPEQMAQVLESKKKEA